MIPQANPKVSVVSNEQLHVVLLKSRAMASEAILIAFVLECQDSSIAREGTFSMK